MPRSYPAEFRQRAVALVRAGQSVTATAAALEITDTCLYNWVKQDRIDGGEVPGVTTKESLAFPFEAYGTVGDKENLIEVSLSFFGPGRRFTWWAGRCGCRARAGGCRRVSRGRRPSLPRALRER